MTGIEILKLFGWEVNEEPQSIYPFSPVYQMSYGHQEVVVKRTQKKAKQVMSYTRMLKAKGIQVVTPIQIPVSNPQNYNEEMYVVYPFIEGKPFSASGDELYEAGKLLGEIHSLSPRTNEFELLTYNVFDFNEEEVDEHTEAIKKHASLVGEEINEELAYILKISVKNQHHLSMLNLPYIATPHDYKANNLVMTPSPYLIDPDNATWLPKIFDLALVLLLFNNEHKHTANRVFTVEEWQLFLKGYLKYGEFTEQEHSNWQVALQHVFLDEVMWLMAEYEEDWLNARQKELFLSLLNLIQNSESYKLKAEIVQK